MKNGRGIKLNIVNEHGQAIKFLDLSLLISQQKYIMEPSVIQLGKQRKQDRNIPLADLNLNLSKLLISVSFDGGMMFNKKLSSGISASDTTQHRIFLFDVNTEDECPIGQPQLTITELGELARSKMICP